MQSLASETRGGPPHPAGRPRASPKRRVLHGYRRVDDYGWLRRKDAPEVLAHLRAENAYTEAIMRPTLPAAGGPLRRDARPHQADRPLGSRPAARAGSITRAPRRASSTPSAAARRARRPRPSRCCSTSTRSPGPRSSWALGTVEVSLDGRRLAYTLDTTGFRVYTLYVKDLRTGKVLADRPSGGRRACSGRTTAGRSFTSPRTPRPSGPTSSGGTRWAATPSKDELIYEETDERFELDVSRTRSDRYLLVSSHSHTTSEVRYLAASSPRGELRVIAPRVAGPGVRGRPPRRPVLHPHATIRAGTSAWSPRRPTPRTESAGAS